MMDRICNWLLERATPRFGQITLWLLLLFALALACLPFEFMTGERSQTPATVFTWLPEFLLGSPVFMYAVRAVLIVSAILWGLKKLIPWSCWMTVIAFTLLWSLRMENVTNGAHIFNLTNMLLIVHAMWFHFYRDEIRSSIRSGNFAASRLYPRWVFLLSVFYVGWFHTLAGISKIMHSGFDWGDGLSLQLWVNLFGVPGSMASDLMLLDIRVTSVLQTAALIFECLCVLSLLHWSIRYTIGFGLFGFYMAVLFTFVTFGFHFNAILVAMFLLPMDRWLKLKFEKGVRI